MCCVCECAFGPSPASIGRESESAQVTTEVVTTTGRAVCRSVGRESEGEETSALLIGGLLVMPMASSACPRSLASRATKTSATTIVPGRAAVEEMASPKIGGPGRPCPPRVTAVCGETSAPSPCEGGSETAKSGGRRPFET